MIIELKEKFVELFGSSPELTVRAPGRINLIGEHTDYNDGFVLPAAIDKAIYIAISKRNDQEIHLYSLDFNESYKTDINSLQPVKYWATYITGVFAQFLKKNLPVKGINLVMHGDIPIGAGLSSSAAVECSVAYALNQLFQLSIDNMELVKMLQQAEHEFAGVKCGIMDQFASMMGKKDHVVRLDCRTLAYEYFPFTMKDFSIVLMDTGVKHSLASSEYNTRRLQCEEGVAVIHKKYPEVKNLRDATIAMLNECVKSDTVIYKRCFYMIQEIERVQAACLDLNNNLLEDFGKKMFETHTGLSELYEVSCEELDFLVNSVKNNPTVLGSRMMGGGFGGCTINLIKNDAIDSVIKHVSEEYQNAYNRKLVTYTVKIEDGVSNI